MKKAILLHGWAHKDEFYDPQYPTVSNSHWFPWLSKQLMIRDIHAIAPEMPSSFYPEYEIWRKEFERFEVDEETILIGHSCGGGFLVRWLSENKDIKAGKVILVAPWIGDDPDQPFEEGFFEFDIDRTLSKRVESFILFNSTNDVEPIQKSVRKIKGSIDDILYREFENKGHFTLKGLGTEEFPELLAEVLK